MNEIITEIEILYIFIALQLYKEIIERPLEALKVAIRVHGAQTGSS